MSPHPQEDLFGLIVELGAVGDRKHAAVPDVLPDPLRQPNHREARAATLGVPDDPSLATLHVPLGRLHGQAVAELADLLAARVERREIVDPFERALACASVRRSP